jgi:hypothetical protein
VFRLDRKLFIWPLTKTGPTKAEYSKNIAMRDEGSEAALLQLFIARCVARKLDLTQSD